MSLLGHVGVPAAAACHASVNSRCTKVPISPLAAATAGRALQRGPAHEDGPHLRSGVALSEPSDASNDLAMSRLPASHAVRERTEPAELPAPTRRSVFLDDGHR